MKDLLDKISSYNIFNYFFPGVIFVVLSDKMTQYSFLQKDVLIGAFTYYFIGLVISRFGSLIIEPLLKIIGFLKFADYKIFIKASKNDEKIGLFSEINNMYRTICSVFLLLTLLKVYEFLELKYPVLKYFNTYLLIALLFIMFLFAYQKQTKYIKKRIESQKE